MTTGFLDPTGLAGAIIDALTFQICVVDRNGVILAVNHAWRRFAEENSETSAHLGEGVNYLEVCERAAGFDAEEATPFAAGARAVLQGRSTLFELEYPCHTPSENRWFLARVTPLDREQGGAVIAHVDISDRKRVELELTRLARTDPLTGLPNRLHLMDAGAKELQRVRRFNVPASTVILDLDHFKDINDTYGHAAGDEALRKVAEACQATLRQSDTLVRLGGEEFVALLPGADESEGGVAAERLRRALLDLRVRIGEIRIHISASIGVAEMSAADVDFDECLSRADLALYRAKRAGRDRVQRFSGAPTLPSRGVLMTRAGNSGDPTASAAGGR